MSDITLVGMSGSLLGGMLHSLGEFQRNLYPALMANFSPFIRVATTLYIVIAGVGIMTGHFKDATKQVLTSCILVVLLHTFIMETGVYLNFVVKPFLGLFGDISTFFLTTAGKLPPGSSDIFSALDSMLGNVVSTIDKIEPAGNILTDAWLYVRATTAMFMLFLVFGFLYGAYIAILIMAYFCIHILFVVGGVCLFFGAFKQTRHITWAWFRGIMNYGLLIIFASIIIAVCFSGVNSALEKLVIDAQQTNDILSSKHFWASIFWGIVTIVMILKAPDLSAVLTGTYPGSTSGIAAGLGAASSKMFSIVSPKSISNYAKKSKGAAGASWAGASKAYSAYKGIKRSSGGEADFAI